MSASNLVLLTATVTPPPDARNLARRDVALRLQDYLLAFDFYLGELRRGSFDRLVLCENSGCELAPFAARVAAQGLAARVELIGFFGLDHPAAHGRGYGEFKLVDHAMRHSALIAALDEPAMVWKVTGRYRVRNLAQLIATQPLHADLYCHCRNLPLRWLDMYLMRWNRRAYRGLIEGVYHALRQDASPTSAEQRFRALVDRHDGGLRIVRRFAQVPRIEGVRGFDNREYRSMWSTHLLRRAARRLAPWVWI
jgi:hypothetical protein